MTLKIKQAITNHTSKINHFQFFNIIANSFIKKCIGIPIIYIIFIITVYFLLKKYYLYKGNIQFIKI